VTYVATKISIKCWWGLDVESYSLTRVAVFCNQCSNVLAKFVFRMSALCYFTHVRRSAGYELN